MKKLVPKRSFKGTLSSDTFRQALGQKEYEWYELIQEKDLDFNKKMLEIVNFMDGKRTAHDIATAISSEYSATDPERVLKFLKDLKKTGFVTFR